jgi:hypothetical protein
VDRLKAWTPYLLVTAAAVLVLFPLSVYPTLLHRTPNGPLHWMVLEHLTSFLQGDTTALSHVIAADFPNGRPVRIIGWPFQLMAVPLVPLVGRVAAMNVALLGSLVLSGMLMVRLLRRMGLNASATAVGGLAWVCNPLMVSFLSNGQYENHVGWALPLTVLGLMRTDIRGFLMLAVGLLGAAFSSPYQAVPVAIVVCAVLLFQPKRLLPQIAATLVVVFGCCYFYYSGPQPLPGGECGPTSGAMPLVVAELFGFTGAVDAEMPFKVDRWTTFLAAFEHPVQWAYGLDLNHLNVAPGSGFVGLLPLIGGIVGLWRTWDQSWSKPLVLGGVVCLALALGPQLEIVRGDAVNLPMPADLLSWLPGISQMGTTLRFMSGVAFVLVVGLAFWVQGMAGKPWKIALVVVLVLTEWVFGTVSNVPMAAKAYQAPAGFDALPASGAVMTVPVMAHVSPEAHLWMGAILGRDVVGYCETPIEDYRREFGVVDFAQGGLPPNLETINSDFALMSEQGISYLAFMVVQPGEEQFRQTAAKLTFSLGTPDAVGNGIIGYRTDRSERSIPQK